MADLADRADSDAPPTTEAEIARLRGLAASMPAGEAGACIWCGKESKRLVGRMCAPCRDDFANRGGAPWK